MGTRHRAVICLLVGLSLMAFGSISLAQTQAEMEQAQHAWELGQQLFEKADYRGAKEQFSRGHQLSRKGGFLYNMAECARMMGDTPQARALYQRYLREYPTGKQHGEALKQCNALGQGDCGEGASNKPLKTMEARRATPLAAKTTKTTSTLSTSIAQAPPPYLPPVEPERPAPSRPFYKHWGLWVGVGAAVVTGSVLAVVLTKRSGGSSNPDADWSADFR